MLHQHMFVPGLCSAPQVDIPRIAAPERAAANAGVPRPKAVISADEAPAFSSVPLLERFLKLQLHGADSHKAIYPSTDENVECCLRSVVAVAELMERLKVPWKLSGGIAIDLHAEHWSRSHSDIDVAVPIEHASRLWSALRESGLPLMRRMMSGCLNSELRITLYRQARLDEVRIDSHRSLFLLPSGASPFLPVDFLFYRQGVDHIELTFRGALQRIPGCRGSRGEAVLARGRSVELFDAEALAFLKADDHPKAGADFRILERVIGPERARRAKSLRCSGSSS